MDTGSIMRIVVTGSEGYIGTNLCKSLRNLSYEVMGLDKINGGDILWDDIEERITKFRPDWIIHLAALPSIAACEENKEQATLENVKTSEVISDIAVNIGCPVIFSSSQASKDPASSHYALCKFEAEKIFRFMNGGYILRFSNIYGGGGYVEKKNSVMASFVKAYKKGEPLIANGDGAQGRDFLHMDDLSQIIIDLMNFAPTKMYDMDVGTGVATSILDVVKMFDCKYTLNPDSGLVGLESNFADTTMMENLIGYYPRPKMKEWIKEITKC